ncbi:MAG: 2-hydroxyacid dehydrogenase [Propionicimonas sp.]|uniref:2-hydroxyacid dehydrogenase n=1 Tax=Propionicimonas sp. TaxID=1955623 RepID=UPI002B202FE7|nr:2-hydroxyacid dehydrogenase [Propionicimonas sp.]MEA4944068.1 2-hydroxyacid dehydrogenase [Propionicimonas sp.]
MTRRVWLPFTDQHEALAVVGPLPDGIEADYFLADGSWPESIGEVELLVAPYMVAPEASLARIDEMVNLRAIQLLSAGYDNFLPCLRPGLQLCNAAGVHDASTAELAVALALASNRRLDHFARAMTSGTWKTEFTDSLADRRVLILGYGRIGKAIEQRLAGFEVASITRVARSARTGEVPVHPIEELPALLPTADVVFVITPLTPQTTGLIGAAELALLPDNALLVNVSRGKVVDTDALVEAVRAGRIRAALDVTDPEPLPSDHPLWQLPGVFISPHTGGQSTAFFPRMGRLLRSQLTKFAAGEPLDNVVA